MEAIKNFIYLDEYKMYSLSSQVFEGITEYLIDYKRHEQEEHEGQKGPIGSGRILADIIKTGSETQEKKFLHDYSYHIFERQLHEKNKVLNISENNIDNFRDEIPNFSFVRIKATATFNDINLMKDTFTNFNKVGEALTYVTNFAAIQEVQQQLEMAEANIKDKNQKAAHRERVKSISNIAKLAKEKGLQQDQKYLDYLSFLLSYGYQDQFEVQLVINDTIFSANLKRESLREDEAILIRKYSRMTEKEFVLFGMITQSSSITEREIPTGVEFKILKEALMNIVLALSNVEGAFIGRLSNEVIIDPIALYVEL